MIPPERAALVLIDMQWGFLDPRSPLCIAGALETVPACARALDAARRFGSAVVHATREYAPDGSDVEITRLAAWLDGRPLSAASSLPRSLEEPEGLSPASGDLSIVKPRFSAFFGTDLHAMLQKRGVNTVVLAGTTTPNCIRSTCYDALSLDYNVVVLEDCTSSRTPAVQAANIEDMRHIGAAIMTSADYAVRGLDEVADLTCRCGGFA